MIDLDKLEGLLAECSQGEWHAGRSDMTSYDGISGEPFKNVYADDERGGVHEPTGERLPYTVARGEGDECHANAQLIAELRNQAPALIAAARERDRLRDGLSEIALYILADSTGRLRLGSGEQVLAVVQRLELPAGALPSEADRLRALLEYGLACAEALESEGWRMVDGTPLKDKIADIRAELGGKSDG